MKIRRVLALRGPNIWAYSPVLEAWVEMGEWNDRASNEIPGFNERLRAWLPSLVEHRCSEGVRGGFFARLERGTYLAHILEHVALDVQSLAGVHVGYGRTRGTSEEGVYRVVFKYKEETLARACLDKALALVMAAAQDEPFDVTAAVAELQDIASRTLLGPSTNAIVEAARTRHIPSRRLDQYSLVQLGHGAKQRRVRAAETDETGAIAQSIAQDKDLTRQFLQSAGVPTPPGYPVKSVEDAWETAEYIGVPVVVKPRDGNQGRGVATNLTTKEQVAAAYQAALAESSEIIVEKFAEGYDHRLLVIGGRLVAASRREPAHVIGDGKRTIRELVDIVNQDPRRGDHHSNILSKIPLDEVSLNVLGDQGYTPESTPEWGERVLIRRNANLSTGGTAVDVTDDVHPDVSQRAVEAALVVGLDIAGIDVVAKDIGVPLEEQGGVVVEVNAAPGLRMHLAPSEGRARPVGQAIVDTLFPPGETGRIPIAAVTGTNGKTTVTRMLAHIVQGTGLCTGMTCTDGIYLNGRRIDSDDCSGPVSAGMVLMNPQVEAAVFETARGGILRAGLAFDECTVAVVTNIADGDHLGLNEVNTPEDLAKVKRGIVEVTGREGTAVLNASDPLTAGMARCCKGSVLFFAIDPENPVIAAHRAQGGRAIFVRSRTVVLAEGLREEPIIAVDEIPMTMGGRIGFEVENALAAMGAACSMGIPHSIVRERAAGFASDMSKVPGRFNVLPHQGGTVIVDYGHNAHSLRTMVKTLDNFPHRRRVALYTMAGDRRDIDIEEIGEILGHAFDRVATYETCTIRGRRPYEIAEILERGLNRGSRVKSFEKLGCATEAMRQTLDAVRPGDLLLLQADSIEETMVFLRGYLESGIPDAVACNL